MSSVDEIEVKVEEQAAAADESAAKENSASVEKQPTTDEDDADVVVPKVEKSMESKPERAKKTILSEMCDHTKPVKSPPSFQVCVKIARRVVFKSMLSLSCNY